MNGLIFGNPVDKGMSDVRKLQKARLNLAERALAAHGQLAELRGRGAEVVLDELLQAEPVEVGKTRKAITETLGLLEDIGIAQLELVKRLHAALMVVAERKSEGPRAEAQKLRERLQVHEQETARLHAMLTEHAGGRWVLDGPVPLPPGTTAPPQSFPMTRAHQMALQVAELERFADAIVATARQKATRGGRVEASSLEELLKATSDVLGVMPFEIEVRAWHAASMAKPGEVWYQRNPDAPRPVEIGRTFLLVWDNAGRILAEQSHCNAVEVEQRVTAADERVAGAAVAQRMLATEG